MPYMLYAVVGWYSSTHPSIHPPHTYTSVHPRLSVHLFTSSMPLFTDSFVSSIHPLSSILSIHLLPILHLSTYPSMHPAIHPPVHLLTHSSIISLSFTYPPTYVPPSLPTHFIYLFIRSLGLAIDLSAHPSIHKSLCCSNSQPVSQPFSTSHRVNYGFTLHGALGVVSDTW